MPLLNSILIRSGACLVAFFSGLTLYGQDLTANTKVVTLPASINSGFEESKPISSASGDTLYFARSFHPDNIGGEEAGSDIWVSYRNSHGHWSMPSNELGRLNTPDNDLVIGISDDGLILYTIKYNFVGSKRYVQIMQSSKQQDAWSKPIPIEMEPILVPGGYHEFSMHSSGTVLLISWKGIDSLGEEDLYISELVEGNRWTKPVNLGVNINSRGFEIAPFLSHDMKRLYFASDRADGTGNSDIWVSTRLQDSPYHWSQPQNLGAKINSDRFDAFYFQTRQGDIYFTSNRNSPQTDIFFLSAAKPVDSVMDTTVETINEEGKAAQSINEVVYFDLDKDYPGNSELERLRDFIAALSDVNIDSIQIIGFTDHFGEIVYNRNLSQRRARETAEIIKSQMKGAIPIQTIGEGVYQNKQAPEEMRRVEIMVHIAR